MILLKRMILAVPLTIGWTIFTAQPSIGNIILGYFFSLAVLIALRVEGSRFNLKNIPMQLVNLFLYFIFLSYEVLHTGIIVARVTLAPNLSLNRGIVKINTQDESENPVISAISAHGITITPGELVVDFEETHEDGVIMVIHSIFMEESMSNLDDDQATRLQRIKGILGYD